MKKYENTFFSRHGKRFIIPIYEGGDIPSYDTLMSSLPSEVVGSFLCLPGQRDDLMRWGRDLMARMFSILQGAEVDFDYNSEIRFSVNPKVIQTWAEQDTTNFLQLARRISH